MKPQYKAGKNIAIKVPPYEYEKTVSFYRDIIGLEERKISSSDQYESISFSFGDKNLWIDKISSVSQAEIWLELVTDNIAEAALHLEKHGVVRRDEIEKLPNDFKGFWICSPSNIIHYPPAVPINSSSIKIGTAILRSPASHSPMTGLRVCLACAIKY